MPRLPGQPPDQLLRRLETDFVAKGGLRERMTRARLSHRDSQAKSKECVKSGAEVYSQA